MAVTGTSTYRELLTEALRSAGVVAEDEEASSDQIEFARKQANRRLKAWQNSGWSRFLIASQSVALTTAASYTLSPVRPLEIMSVRFKRDGREIPMYEMSRGEYDDLPVKTTTGTPTQFHYDRQREAARLLIWPVLGAANGETLEITYIREIEDVVLDDPADIPGEAYDAFVLDLGNRLSMLSGIPNPLLAQMAREAMDDMMAFDRQGSIYFMGYDET